MCTFGRLPDHTYRSSHLSPRVKRMNMAYFCNNDISLYYREKGEGDLLIILPGNTATSVCHEDDLNYFSQSYHAVSMDFRGTGHSQRLPLWPENWWDTCADDIAALVRHLDQKHCILLGTSGGANIALLFAIKYPQLVSAVIADSCAEIHAPINLRKEVTDRALCTKEQVDFWAYANGKNWQDVVDHDNQLLLKLANQGGDLYKGSLSSISCPVLFTGSLKDSFIPDLEEQNLNMAKQIEHNTLFSSNTGEHPFMWSCPDVFRHITIQFLMTVHAPSSHGSALPHL